MNSPEIVDYVVIGGGSAGCAVAAGLARSGKHSVVLLEAGRAERSIWTRVPAGVAYLIRDERVVRKFYTQPEARLKDRPIYWPRGRVLGGSSTVNGMIWVHGDPQEYDRWRDEYGLSGWDNQSFKAYLRRVERFQAGDSASRGRQGPVVVSEYGPRQPLMDAFVAACVQAGIPANADYNGLHYEGVGYLQMNTRRGLRVSARDAYLASLPRRSRRFCSKAVAHVAWSTAGAERAAVSWPPRKLSCRRAPCNRRSCWSFPA